MGKLLSFKGVSLGLCCVTMYILQGGHEVVYTEDYISTLSFSLKSSYDEGRITSR